MVNLSTRVPNCDSHSPALLDLFIFSGATICSTIAFPPLGDSDIVLVSDSMPSFMTLLMTILMLIGTIFMII